MDDLFSFTRDLGAARTSSALFSSHNSGLFARSNSRALSVAGLSDLGTEDASECSDTSHGCSFSGRRIAIAKQVLAEATHTFTPALQISGGKSAKSKNTGALGPLLVMLQESQDDDKIHFCLETLSFLLLDRANRKTVSELNGASILLQLYQTTKDPAVQISALEALVNLVKSEDASKDALWKTSSATLLGLLSNARHSAPQLVDTLTFLKKVSFHTNVSPPQLIDPKLLPALADLLHPAMDTAVLLKSLRFLKLAADHPNPEHLTAWTSCIFKLVPLLGLQGTPGRAATVDSALVVLLSLSEHPAFKNALYASGCLPSLLGLLVNDSKSIRVSAVCTLSGLAESGLSRKQLCQEPSLLALLRALQNNLCVEVSIGVLYILSRLAAYKAAVTALLKQLGAVPVVYKLLQSSSDEDAVLGAVQLLELLGASGSSIGSSPRSGSSGSSGSSSPKQQSNTVACQLPHAGSAALRCAKVTSAQATPFMPLATYPTADASLYIY